MGKIVVAEFDLHDKNNILLPEQTLVAYPYNTALHGTTATEPGGVGHYIFTFDPAGVADDLIIARKYDIWNTTPGPDVLLMSDVQIGVAWVWFVRKQITTTPQVIDFNVDLVDENGDALPNTIPNAKIQIANVEEDRLFHFTAQSDTGFTIVASVAGDGSLPVYVNFVILAGEA